ncbi:MAG: hypothetical protein KDD45_12750 [Bdellovibrionales bacterium]|nr:hypothetical protein [Bdellovibrionales bacterium]
MDDNLKQWIELSLKAPSGDNAQPWKIYFDNSCFYVSIDEVLANHFLDQNFASSWISIGALYENLEQCSESFGFSCKSEYIDDMTIKVSYQKINKKVNQTIIDTIRSRLTFRGKLRTTDWRISSQELGELSWGQKNRIPKDLIKDWAELETLLWLKTPLMKDFTKWVHPWINGYQDGLSIKNLMLNTFDSISLLSFKFFPMLIRLVPRFFFQFNTEMRLNYLLDNSAGVIFLSGKGVASKDFFNVGRSVQKTWLELTQAKLRAQPLAIQSLYFTYLENPVNHRYLTQSDMNRVKEIKKKTLKVLNIEGEILYMLRFGSNDEQVQLMPRKKLELFLKTKL